MKISCPNCSAAYELDDSRVPPSGLNIKCPKCKNPFTVHQSKAEAAKPGGKAVVRTILDVEPTLVDEALDGRRNLPRGLVRDLDGGRGLLGGDRYDRLRRLQYQGLLRGCALWLLLTHGFGVAPP